MDTMDRWKLHGKIMGSECWWMPLAAGLLVGLVLLQGGDRIANEKALWLWSELVLPLIGLVLAAFHSSRAADPHQGVVLTSGAAGRRTYHERFVLLLTWLALLGYLVNGLLAVVLQLNPVPVIAAWVSILSLPVLVFFSSLAVAAANGFKSASGGAALAGGVWLLFILLAVLADQALWEPVYPFLAYFHPSAKGLALNRCLLLCAGLLILVRPGTWTIGFRNGSALRHFMPYFFLLPIGFGFAIGFVNSGQPLFSTAPQTRDERWQQDVRFLERELTRRHANVFHTVSAEDFYRAANDLYADVPVLSDEEILARLMRWLAMIGDAHTRVDLASVPNLHIYPLKLQWFQDGLFVVGAAQEYAHLIGAQILQIGDTGIEEAYQAVAALIPHANEGWLRYKSPDYLVSVEILHGVGIMSETQAGQFTLKTLEGEVVQMVLAARPRDQLDQWVEFPDDGQLYRQHAEKAFWFRLLPETQTLYFKYNRCEGRNEFAAMNRVLWEAVDQSRPKRLLIDLRNNRGGNGLVFAPFLKELEQHPEYNQPDRLFVIIDGSVFSSALINAFQLRQQTRATFVGSEAGDWINHYGEVEMFRLPYHPITIWYATRQFSLAEQQEQRLMPDQWINPSSREFFNRRDPLVEAVLSNEEPSCPAIGIKEK